MAGREGDEASFTAFVASRRAALLRAARLVTRDPRLAEDLVQEALVKVAARWERLRDQDPEAYARRIVYRDAVSWWRRTRREESRDPGRLPAEERAGTVAAGDGGARELDAVDDRVALDAALARLTPKQRAVLVLRFYEDRSEREAADVLGVGVGTVKSQTSAALARLRTLAPHLAPGAEAREPERTELS